jgi:hypothetical protein
MNIKLNRTFYLSLGILAITHASAEEKCFDIKFYFKNQEVHAVWLKNYTTHSNSNNVTVETYKNSTLRTCLSSPSPSTIPVNWLNTYGYDTNGIKNLYYIAQGQLDLYLTNSAEHPLPLLTCDNVVIGTGGNPLGAAYDNYFWGNQKDPQTQLYFYTNMLHFKYTDAVMLCHYTDLGHTTYLRYEVHQHLWDGIGKFYLIQKNS